MGYTTYEFYTNEYGGTIEEADFKRLLSKAEYRLNYITSDMINDEHMSDKHYNKAVQMSECTILDILYNLDMAGNKSGISEDGKGKIIKSVSSGSESISYDTGNDIYSKMLGSLYEQNIYMRNEIKIYLADTGLLCCGMR